MKLVTLDEYSGMNWPSLAACFFFCLGRKHNQLAVFFFFSSGDFVLPFHAQLSSETTK